MASEKKKRKTSKKNHWGRGGNFLKWKGARLKGIAFYTSSERQRLKKISYEN